jgi:hypothetical protein
MRLEGAMRIERAKVSDFTSLIVDDISKFMNDGFAVEVPPRKFDPVRFKLMVSIILENTDAVAYLLFDSHNRCQGVFIGVIAPDIVTSDELGTQLVWRVSGDGKGYGMELLRAFTDWCRIRGATKVVAAGGHGDEQKNRLAIKLRLQGFSPAIEHWVRRV